MKDKEALRALYIEKRQCLSEEEVDQLSLSIVNRLLKMEIWDYNYYHLFLSIAGKNEVNTDYLLHVLHGKDKSVVIPRTNFSNMELSHILLQENTVLEIGRFDIPEPRDGLHINPDKLDVVFVPLLAFDKNGNRIGYGGGFYDRFLKNCRKDCLKIGLTFFEAEEEIPHENTDFPLDYCISPKKIYSF